jgi:hypothetical protein
MAHKQSVNNVLPGSVVLLEGHNKQALGPSKFLYVPGTHAVHNSALAPVHPALHVHALLDVLPAGAFEFDGHDQHSR